MQIMIPWGYWAMIPIPRVMMDGAPQDVVCEKLRERCKRASGCAQRLTWRLGFSDITCDIILNVGVVLDTSVLIAALRSSVGAAAENVRLAEE